MATPSQDLERMRPQWGGKGTCWGQLGKEDAAKTSHRGSQMASPPCPEEGGAILRIRKPQEPSLSKDMGEGIALNRLAPCAHPQGKGGKPEPGGAGGTGDLGERAASGLGSRAQTLRRTLGRKQPMGGHHRGWRPVDHQPANQRRTAGIKEPRSEGLDRVYKGG